MDSSHFMTLCYLDREVHRLTRPEKEWLTPKLEFPPHCVVQFTPTTLAQTRFMIWKKETPDRVVSVYLDCLNLLGCCEKPYFEVYGLGTEDSGPWRFALNDGEKMMARVTAMLDGVEIFPEDEESEDVE